MEKDRHRGGWRMTYADITVVIPHHFAPGRSQTLARCIESIGEQTLQPAQVIIEVDVHRYGAATTRDHAIRSVGTRWTALIDSDDFMLPHHLETLYDTAVQERKDYVFSYFLSCDQHEGYVPDDPLNLFAHKFNREVPTQTTTT